MACLFKYNNEWLTEEQLRGVYNHQTNTPIKASAPTLKVVKAFNERTGIDTETVAAIVVDGKVIGANGIAFPMQKLVQVVYGREEEALPEESMHIAVELLKQKNPALFKEMFNSIGNYAIYNQTLAAYSKNSFYQIDGKPDIRKIKIEAIGKLLAATLEQQVMDNEQRVATAQGWLTKVLDWLKSLFNKADFNPFIEFSTQIIAGTEDLSNTSAQEDGAFLQINQAVADLRDKILAENDNLALVGQNTEDRRYEYKGERIEQSVTQEIKKKTTFPQDKTEYEKMLEQEYMKWGSNGHADIDHLISINIDENGLLIQDPIDDVGYTPMLGNAALYGQLAKYIREKLETYPVGTVFLSEKMAWNGRTGKSSLASTLDFVALIPDAKLGVKIDILDWKFKSLDTDQFDDIPWYSIKDWNAQMAHYKKFLQGYGVKAEQFRNTRMIPIIIDYKDVNSKDKMKGKLPASLEIGNNNVKIEGKAYLLPVPLESEVVENKKYAELLSRLRGLYERLQLIDVEEHRKDLKAKQLNSLFSAIRQLQVRENLSPIVEQAQIINESVERFLKKHETLQDASTLSQKDRSDFINSIGESIDNLSIYTTLYTELNDTFPKEPTPEEQKFKDDIAKVSSNAAILQLQLKELDERVVQEYVVNGRVNDDILKPEVRRTTAQRNIVSLSEQGTVALQTLARISQEITFNTTKDRDEQRKIIDEVEKEYLPWANSQGLTKREDVFSPFYNTKKHKFINEVDSEFYKGLKKAITDKDIKWLNENVDMEAYKARIAELKKKELQDIDEETLVGTDEEQLEKKKKAKRRVEKKYDLKGNGLFNRLELPKFVKKDMWYSKEFKYLQAHPVAMKAYKYFMERNEWMKEIGYITEFQAGRSTGTKARTFAPFVRKSWLEGIQTGTNVNYIDRFINDFSVTEDDTAYGEIDPVTKRVVDKIPKYLTKDYSIYKDGKRDYTDFSSDLFKMYDSINNFAINWEYTREREAQAMQLLRIEEAKESLQTSNFALINIKEGTSGEDIADFETDPSNEVNSKLLRDMIRGVIYKQRYVDNEDVTLGSMNKLQKVGYALGNAWNKILGKDVLPAAEFQERKMSVNKTIDTINRGFRLKLLGFNFITGGVNFIGGNSQVLINSGKYFNKKEFIGNGVKLATKRFGADHKKLSALIAYFSPLLDDVNRRKNKNLSTSTLEKFDLSDTMLALQTSGDEWIQYNITLSMLENAAVVDGKIENIREYIRNSPEFAKRYESGVTEKERKDLEATFETRVAEMKKNNLLSQAEFKDDKITIPGIDGEKSMQVFDYRRKIQQISKDATGNMSDDDRRRLNMSVYGSSFMMFKNWIPRLFEVRVASLSTHGDSYEWGRMRMVAKILLQETKFSLSTLHSMYKGTEKGVDAMRKIYEKKREEYWLKNGKRLKMTEAEFFDMMRQNIKAQTTDVLFLLTLLGMVLATKALAPDDDEDKEVTNAFKFYLRAADKVTDEISFYYNPLSMQQILNGSVFPALGAVTSAARMTGAIGSELFGIALGDTSFKVGNLELDGEQIREDAKPIKYTMKTFRVANQMLNYIPIFYPDAAKDLGIKVSTESRLR